MSGPKKSEWQIRQEEYQRRKEEKIRERENKKSDVKNELQSINNKISKIIGKYKQDAHYIENVVNDWIDEVKCNLSGDLRVCYREIKGINNYIDNQEPKLQKLETRRLKEDKRREELELKERKIALEKELKQKKIDRIIEDLEAVSLEYKEILNSGITQRVELFKKSIETNPDNENTIKQINAFKENLNNIYTEYQDKLDDRRYVAQSFALALNGNIDEGSDGNFSVNGSIDGVNISVNLPKDSNSIDLDTPTDGSCRKGLDALLNKLSDANIELGVIKVVKTGEIFNQNSIKIAQNRIKS